MPKHVPTEELIGVIREADKPLIESEIGDRVGLSRQAIANRRDEIREHPNVEYDQVGRATAYWWEETEPETERVESGVGTEKQTSTVEGRGPFKQFPGAEEDEEVFMSQDGKMVFPAYDEDDVPSFLTLLDDDLTSSVRERADNTGQNYIEVINEFAKAGARSFNGETRDYTTVERLGGKRVVGGSVGLVAGGAAILFGGAIFASSNLFIATTILGSVLLIAGGVGSIIALVAQIAVLSGMNGSASTAEEVDSHE